MNRTIKHIVVHCTATQPLATVESIQNYWKNVLKWKNPGYHFLIDYRGFINQLLDVSLVANGVAGHNSTSVHVSYIGGIDKQGKPHDTRNQVQRDMMKDLLLILSKKFPEAKILGHRDFPNVNKACPSFDVAQWLKEIDFETLKQNFNGRS